ncbi:MAG: retropepsin-like aspartic protease [Candidatus Tumulicola sp.]
MCAAAFALTGVVPSPAPAPPAALAAVLAAHLHALQGLKAIQPRTLQTHGTLEGLGLHGTFQSWRAGDDQRYDETLGIRTQRTLRLGDAEFVRNANGDVRELRGLAARRQVTEDFIDSGEFARHPENDVLLGRAKLRDGRDVLQLRVSPPGGEPYGIALDAATSMVDEKAYLNGDAVSTIDYSEYRVVDGVLYPLLQVESSGDPAFDITSHVTGIRVNAPVDPAIFAPLTQASVDLPAPVTLPLLDGGGHFFVRASANGKSLLLLVDSGSQGLFLDPAAAQRLGLTPEGTLEIRGAKRTSGAGVAALDHIDLGSARLPAHVVSVVDLSAVTYNGVTIDGVLGYPFFAAAEVRIDPEKLAMTIAKPGTLAVRGTPIPIDTDRELPEMSARLNGNVDGRFLVDTGNSNDLLVFHAFVQAHPGVVFYGEARTFSRNTGIGGSSVAVPAIVYRLEMGPFNLYNRYADVMLADTGAFADGNEAGNIGLATLRNFVCTFDFFNHRLYLDKTRSFDDGRYRPQFDRPIPRPP